MSVAQTPLIRSLPFWGRKLWLATPILAISDFDLLPHFDLFPIFDKSCESNDPLYLPSKTDRLSRDHERDLCNPFHKNSQVKAW